MNNTEVITTHDKDRRDRLFDDLRQNGNALERQVVKFSGVELAPGEDGLPKCRAVFYRVSGSKYPKAQMRWVYRSTWSVAYPRT